MNFPNTIAGWAILIIVILGIVGILYIGITQLGIPIPHWIMQIIGILFVCFIVVAAIKLLVGTSGNPPVS